MRNELKPYFRSPILCSLTRISWAMFPMCLGTMESCPTFGRGFTASRYCYLIALVLAAIVLPDPRITRGSDKTPEISPATGHFVKRVTWQDTMLASRARLAPVLAQQERDLQKLTWTSWYTTGPVQCKRFSDILFPEQAVDLAASDASDQPLWRKRSDWIDGQVHALEDKRQATYLFRTITSNENLTLTAYVAADSGAKIWLNGQGLLSKEYMGLERIDRVQVDLPLVPGENRLLLKVFNDRSSSGFYFSAREDATYHVWKQIQRDFPIAWDWVLQDVDGDILKWFGGHQTADIERPMIVGVLDELGPDGESLRSQFERLCHGDTPVDDRRWLDLYVNACEKRRARRLARLLERYPQIVFTKHYNLGGSHYAYTEGQSDAQRERHFTPGSSLCLLELDGIYGNVRTLIADPDGVIRDPDVSYEGNRILFAWKKSDRLDDYHLHEMDLSSGAVRQLTFGLGFADYEGVYLPCGDILFTSSRCVQTVDCWWTEVSNLYRCAGDGSYLRRLSFDQVHANYPQVLDDGRVIYTRWDYNDRGQIYPQPLYQMNSDGTGQTEFYGNNSWVPTTIMHARGIPATQKVVAVLSGHHSHQRGKLAIIDPAYGRQEASGVQLIAPVRHTPAERIDAYGQDGDQFQYPYAISGTEFLVTYDPIGSERRKYDRPYGIYLMNIDGRRELLAWDPEISSSQPVPLVPRSVSHRRSSPVDYRSDTGTYYLQDIHLGPGLDGIPRGTIKSLRVVALEFRAAGVGSNNNRGPAGGALVSTPISVGNGTWDVKRVLGEAEVYEDGSACFTVPARTPVYFQALNEKRHVVQTMRTWSTLQPGETMACVGCHESKSESVAYAGESSLALNAGPQPLEPFYGPPRGFSFPKEIQPILNRHCIRCHDDRNRAPHLAGAADDSPAEEPLGSSPDRSFSLLADTTIDPRAKRQWSDAYLALTNSTFEGNNDKGTFRGMSNELVNWISVQSSPEMLPPYDSGAAKSRLISMLNEGHYEVELSPGEMDRIACWIDLLVPYCGDYTEANAWSDEERAMYARFQAKRDRMAAVERKNVEALVLRDEDLPAESRRETEPGTYRNVALNPNDRQGEVQSHPHASSNSEYHNLAWFAACSAIDGRTDNLGHGRKYPSWGPDKRTDLWWKVEFGRAVTIDKVVLIIRADFPHDKHWHSATIEFSDGSRETIKIAKTAQPQSFRFEPRTVDWLKLVDFVQDEPLGWCALTEVEIWGRDHDTMTGQARLDPTAFGHSARVFPLHRAIMPQR